MTMQARRGMTLTEVLIATTLTVAVALAFVKMDLTRLLLSDQVRNSGATARDANLALLYLIKNLERADRVVFQNGVTNRIQFRIPAPDTDCPIATTCPPACPPCPVVCSGCTGTVPPACCLDIPANYRWAQYSLVGSELQFFDDVGTATGGRDCTVDNRFPNLNAFTVRYINRAPAPPGGGPVDDNNIVDISLTGFTGDRTWTVRGQATIRAGAYSNRMDGLPINGNPADFNPPQACP